LSVVHDNKESFVPYRYGDMIQLYIAAIAKMEWELETTCASTESLMTAPPNNHGISRQKLRVLTHVLKHCTDALQHEQDSMKERGCYDSLPGVVCHMDLQPQNMILRRRRPDYNHFSCKENSMSFGHIAVRNTDVLKEDHNSEYMGSVQDEIPHIACVLDWEESCYADPRFELLLLCRKVVANRDQAQLLWDYYSKAIYTALHDVGDYGLVTTGTSANAVGPIDPWLKLETLHSIITLLLQSMDLLGGGRSPWESKPDLWSKMDREFRRLDRMGWAFCKEAIKVMHDISESSV